MQVQSNEYFSHVIWLSWWLYGWPRSSMPLACLPCCRPFSVPFTMWLQVLEIESLSPLFEYLPILQLCPIECNWRNVVLSSEAQLPETLHTSALIFGPTTATWISLSKPVGRWDTSWNRAQLPQLRTAYSQPTSKYVREPNQATTQPRADHRCMSLYS